MTALRPETRARSPFGPVRSGLVTPLARFNLAAALWTECAVILDRPYLSPATRAAVAALAAAVDAWHREAHS